MDTFQSLIVPSRQRIEEIHDIEKELVIKVQRVVGHLHVELLNNNQVCFRFVLEFGFNFQELPVVKPAIGLGVTCDARIEDSLKQGVHLALVVNLEGLDLHLKRLFFLEDLLHLFYAKARHRY